jgi:hypothetical protein
METDKAAESLRALAISENRSKMGRLRELVPYIENAKAAGVGLGKVLETLNAHGMDMKMQSFKSMLYRIRQEKKKNPAVNAAKPTPKNEVITGAHQAQQTAETAKYLPAPARTKVGEPKRFNWDLEGEKPEW